MNNREIAIIFWIIIGILFLMKTSKGKNSLFHLYKAIIKFLTYPISLLLVAYNILILFLICRNTNLLTLEFIKDYLMAAVLLVPFILNSAENTLKHSLLEEMKGYISIASISLFLISMNIFPIIIELILFPVYILLIMLLIYAERSPNLVKVKRFFEIIILIIMLILITSSLISNFSELTDLESLVAYLFELLVWIANIPIIIIIKYMLEIDVKLNVFQNEKTIYQYLRFYLIKTYMYLKYRKYLRIEVNEKFISDAKEYMSLGGNRIIIYITMSSLPHEQIIAIFLDAILGRNKFTNLKNERGRFPLVVELRNSQNNKLIGFWEEPEYKDKYKRLKLKEGISLVYGIKVQNYSDYA